MYTDGPVCTSVQIDTRYDDNTHKIDLPLNIRLKDTLQKLEGQ